MRTFEFEVRIFDSEEASGPFAATKAPLHILVSNDERLIVPLQLVSLLLGTLEIEVLLFDLLLIGTQVCHQVILQHFESVLGDSVLQLLFDLDITSIIMPLLACICLTFIPFHLYIVLMMQLNKFVHFVEVVVQLEIVDQLNGIALDDLLPRQELVRLRQVLLVHVAEGLVFSSNVAVVNNHILERLLAFPVASVGGPLQRWLVAIKYFFIGGARQRSTRLVERRVELCGLLRNHMLCSRYIALVYAHRAVLFVEHYAIFDGQQVIQL